MSIPKRVLVTGGSGFIGANLTRTLLDAGHDVHLFLRPTHSPWRLQEITSRFTAHSVDLRDGTAVREHVQAIAPQWVFHLGVHGAYPGQKQRQEILQTNILGTANLIDALEWVEPEAFIHTGSSSEYGHHSQAMRTDSCLTPRSDYAVAKAAATYLVQAESLRGRSFATVRVFSAYGPWEDPNRLVPYVMEACARGVSPLVTAGEQPRDFIYVQDVVDFLLHLALNPTLCRGIYNAGTGQETRVKAMVEAICRVCTRGKVKARYGEATARPDEPQNWYACMETTTRQTGWQARYNLNDGLKAMWAWYRLRQPAPAKTKMPTQPVSTTASN